MREHHTKNKGDLGVLKVQCRLAELDYTVLIPLTEHEFFDLVAYKDGIFKRIQVKYRSAKNGKMEIRFRSSWADKHGSHSQLLDKNKVDIFAIYCPETDKCYFLEPQKFGECVLLRVDTPKNNQMSGIHFADDYLEVP